MEENWKFIWKSMKISQMESFFEFTFFTIIHLKKLRKHFIKVHNIWRWLFFLLEQTFVRLNRLTISLNKVTFTTALLQHGLKNFKVTWHSRYFINYPAQLAFFFLHFVSSTWCWVVSGYLYQLKITWERYFYFHLFEHFDIGFQTFLFLDFQQCSICLLNFIKRLCFRYFEKTIPKKQMFWNHISLWNHITT